LAALPASPLSETARTLSRAKRVVLLTGFPVLLPDGSVTGETDGPSGTANLAYAFCETGCRVTVVTDRISYPLLKAALAFRAPSASLLVLPNHSPELWIRERLMEIRPTHFISLERPARHQTAITITCAGKSLTI